MDFLKKNGGLIALVVVLVGSAVFFVLRSAGGPKDDFRDTVAYVCVKTGKVFHLPKGVTRIPPVENPETKEPTLFPCAVRDDGVYVSDRYRDSFRSDAAGATLVDAKTLKVNKAP